MTSDVTRDCFVYVVLPGETAFVPAARFQLTADRTGARIAPAFAHPGFRLP